MVYILANTLAYHACLGPVGCRTIFTDHDFGSCSTNAVFYARPTNADGTIFMKISQLQR
jgi:hypothetical protein